MLKRLPVFVEPIRCAEEGKSIVGEMGLAEMDRIKAYLLRSDTRVSLELVFGVDDQRHKFLSGRLRTEMAMACQRCLQEMIVPISCEFLLGLVTNEHQANNLPEDYEPLMVTSKSMKLASIVEDELILALPFAPLHSDSGCQVVDHNGIKSIRQRGGNPFTVLKGLKMAKS